MYTAECNKAHTRGLMPYSHLLGTEFDPWDIPRGIGTGRSGTGKGIFPTGRSGTGKGIFPRTSVFSPNTIPRIIPITDVL
jgi:hypothetical protein